MQLCNKVQFDCPRCRTKYWTSCLTWHSLSPLTCMVHEGFRICKMHGEFWLLFIVESWKHFSWMYPCYPCCDVHLETLWSTTSQKVESLSPEDHLAFVVQGQILWAIFAHIRLQQMLFQKRNKDCFQALSTVKCFKKRIHSNDYEDYECLIQLPSHRSKTDDDDAPGYQRWKSAPWRSAKLVPRIDQPCTSWVGAWVGEMGFVQLCGECPNQAIFQDTSGAYSLFMSHWSCQK